MSFVSDRRTKSYYKRTRKGNVLHLVEDYYLRTDLGMGVYHGDQLNMTDFIALIRENYEKYREKRKKDGHSQQKGKEGKGQEKGKGRRKGAGTGKGEKGEEAETLTLVESPFTLVLDTNTILHQIDFLEQKSDLLQILVIPHTVMEETKNQSLSIYRRLKKLLLDKSRSFIYFPNENHRETYVERVVNESINDRNDRSIRKVVDWYRCKVGPFLGDVFEREKQKNKGEDKDEDEEKRHHRFIMISSDVANRKLAKEEHIPTLSIHTLIQAINPKLLDLLSSASSSGHEHGHGHGQTSSSSSTTSSSFSSKTLQQNVAFPGMEEHIPGSEIQAGVKEGLLFQGVLRCVRRSPWFCSVTVKGLNGADRVPVAIHGPAHVNRAIDGDIVAIEILPPDQWINPNDASKQSDFMMVEQEEKDDSLRDGESKGKSEEEQEEVENESGENNENNLIGAVTATPKEEDITNNHRFGGASSTVKPTGRVVGIVKRNWRNYCGSILLSADTVDKSFTSTTSSSFSTNVLVAPVDKKLPFIKITTRQRDELVDKRILVAIDSWPITSRNPIGHYVRTLGKIGEKGIETEVLLHEFDIPWEPFSEKVMACLPPPDWKITVQNSKGRRDLRDIPVMSVDPPGCKDIDDALHCYKLPNGNYHVGVHIADVSYFVQPNTPLDEEAANRGTSTYLVEKRLDMLPKLLTESVCSLTDDCDHFAFSVLWEMTDNAEIVKVDFCKSIIRSIGALSYGEAQLIKDDPHDKDSIKATSIRGLCHLASILKEKRREAGALELASPQVSFKLDSESQSPVDVQLYQLKETNSMVEEFMLLANITVGKKILRHFPLVSCLRRHPSPSQVMFDPLIAAAHAVGVEIKVDDSKALQVSLDQAHKEEDPYFNSLIRILSTRCMAPAQYFVSGELPEEQWHHYGLAAPIYTHFTSPIRRYADVLVHRLLAAAIGVHSLPIEMEDRGSLHDICENLNRRNRAADLAGRASVNYNTVVFFRENPALNEEAYVLRVAQDRLTVLVPRYGIEGNIKLSEENDAGMLTYNAEDYTLMYNPTQNKIKIFDKIRVKIKVQKQQKNGPQEDVVVVEIIEPSGFGFSLSKYKGKRKEEQEEEEQEEDGMAMEEEEEEEDEEEQQQEEEKRNWKRKKIGNASSKKGK